jgi:transcriptional regulator with XRE-family HTH domain
MTQDSDLDALVRRRIRGLRLARGWSLDALAARSFLSPSNLSRIETGHRRVALDQLLAIATALGTTLDQLVEATDDADVVIRPEPERAGGRTTWLLTREGTLNGITAAKVRIRPGPPMPVDAMRVHPGREWFTVLSGTIRLQLAERTIRVGAGEAAEFSTMIPHAVSAHERVAEILSIFDRDGERAHLRSLETPTA